MWFQHDDLFENNVKHTFTNEGSTTPTILVYVGIRRQFNRLGNLCTEGGGKKSFITVRIVNDVNQRFDQADAVRYWPRGCNPSQLGVSANVMKYGLEAQTGFGQ